MILFRALNQAGDWQWGYGFQSYFANQSAINADIATALKTFLGECWFATNLGVDWLNLIGAKNPAAMAAIVLQTRTVINSRNGVTAINSVIPQMNGRSLTITYNINTIYSKSVQNTVPIL